MPSISDAAESVSRFRKLAQDMLAPELQGIKAKLDALHESQRILRSDLDHVRAEIAQVRGEMGQVRSEVGQVRGEIGQVRSDVAKVQGEVGGLRSEIGTLREDMKERDIRLRAEMKEGELRTLKAIETAAREIMITIKLADYERQFTEISKRM